MSKRYVPVKCLKTKDGYIPFWELNVFVNENNVEGYHVENGSYIHYRELVDCIWDITDKKVLLGTIKDNYDYYKKKFSIGEEILIEVDDFNGETYAFDKIIDILYEDYEVILNKVKKLQYYKYMFSEEELSDPETLYEIRLWKPSYKLESGKLINYEYYYKLKHIKK